MLDTAAPPFPELHAAPFWMPISLREYGTIIGEPIGPDDLDPMPGWELAVFSVYLGQAGRVSVCGWVQGPFAIAYAAVEERDTPLGQLYHLPTGLLVSTFADAGLAAFAAATITDLADWPALTALRLGDLPHRVRARLEDAGFHYRVTPVPCGHMIPVWFREIGGLN